MKRIKFNKGRHVTGYGTYEPGDEIFTEDKLAGQLVAQHTAEYVEVSKPRKMVEEKTEVKKVETKITFDDQGLKVDDATD